MKDDSVHILLVEDSPSDVRLTIEVLREARFRSRLSIANDGDEAIGLLKNGMERPEGLPDLVLLDLNLPKTPGHEVLRFIKEDPLLRPIPVIVLTSSQATEDVQRSYALHANCHIAKPVNLTDFLTVVRTIEQFWLKTVDLPRKETP